MQLSSLLVRLWFCPLGLPLHFNALGPHFPLFFSFGQQTSLFRVLSWGLGVWRERQKWVQEKPRFKEQGEGACPIETHRGRRQLTLGRGLRCQRGLWPSRMGWGLAGCECRSLGRGNHCTEPAVLPAAWHLQLAPPLPALRGPPCVSMVTPLFLFVPSGRTKSGGD